MARSFHQLILLGVLAGLGAQSLAEPPADKSEKKRRKGGNVQASAEFENVRRALDALTPEQRKRFQENFWRWANLSPEEKKALRDREEMRKRFMEQEIQMAIQESGLTLEGPTRERFVKRYGQERRKIEEQLRKEMMEKRKPLVKELIGRLKEEFSDPASTPEEPAQIAPVNPTNPQNP